MWYYRKGTVLTLPGIIIAAATVGYFVGAIAQIAVAKSLHRIVRGNDYIIVWICITGVIMGFQALYVMSTFRATSRYLSYPAIWMLYSLIAAFHILLLIISFGVAETSLDAITVAPLLLLAGYVFWYAMRARRGYCVDKIMGLPDYRIRLADSYGRSYFYLLASLIFSWTSKIMVVLILLSLTIQSYWIISDNNGVSRPGQLVLITVPETTKKYNLHVYCTGINSSSSKPTFVFLSEFGYPGVSMIDTVNSLGSQGYAACLIDRPGYGWSEPGYFPQRPESLVDEINQALTCYPVPKPYILVGWGNGGLYAQLYIQKFQENVHGVALLNSYPSQTILQDYAYNNTVVLQNLVLLASGQYGYYNKEYEKSISVKYENWRVFSVFGFARSTLGDFFDWLSVNTKKIRYFEYGFNGNSLYVDLLKYVTNSTNSFLQMNSWPLRWPSFPSGTATFSISKRDNNAGVTVENSVTTVNSTLISVTNTTSVSKSNFEKGINDYKETQSNYGYSASTTETWAAEATPTYISEVNVATDLNNRKAASDSNSDNLAARKVNLSPAPAFLSPVPLLIMVDQMSISGDCQLANLKNPRECQNYQALSWFRYMQQLQYYQTLSSKATFIVCTGPVSEDNKVCNEDFVLSRPTWLANQLIIKFFQ
ncbi:hypothetical protein BB561_000788 [Smittium simulii]|uniref:AB hydrolase-1 domain-containing protein n=1 Tax=Smittium simulii TaxID=133385 RepID=A0A2T9YXL4_9FUNG|nr:hypothetical protein BB561_000788 [Smittium simulii]